MPSFMIMHGYKIFYKTVIGHYFIYEPIFSPCFLFITSENIRKPYVFLMFSEGIKGKQIGKNGLLNNALLLVATLLI